MATSRMALEGREQLAARLQDARERTDSIFERLTPAALYERPVPERHRLVFYLGHLEAFDWNLIARGAARIEPFDVRFDKLFAFGIDPVGGGLPNEPASQWPAETEVRAYNAEVRRIVDSCLAEADFTRPEWNEGQLFDVAIEHRLMHAETLAYLIHQLAFEHKLEPEIIAAPVAAKSAFREVRIPAGRATLGLTRGGPFGWDNEFESNTVDVPAFAIDSHDVTNGQFLEFVDAGGYRNRALWSDADWAWLESERREHPQFWERDAAGWRLRGMFASTPLPLDHPVYVSHAEASAYARWKGRALPSEAQFHRAAYGTPEGNERDYPWGEEPPAARHGNFDFHRWDTVPVGSHPAGDSVFGVSDLVGNGWEWTSSLFAPFPGFTAFPFYKGYSADFFDGHHFVMKGGSPRTAACMLRRSFRNWFQPHYTYAFATFRTVDR